MTLEQIQLLKESYMKESKRPDGKRSTLGEYMAFCLDGGVAFVTSKDLVVFDDTNELLHSISINNNAKSQADFPIKVTSSEYSMVQQVETIMSQTNFEKFLSEGFISSMIGDEKKEFIKKWSRGIRNQAQQPMDPEPCYEDTVYDQINPMPTSVLPKDIIEEEDNNEPDEIVPEEDNNEPGNEPDEIVPEEDNNSNVE